MSMSARDGGLKPERLLLAVGAAALLLVSAPLADARTSASGPRGPSGGVEFAPVDRLGPTLAPDEQMTPDSGWNGSAASDTGVLGPRSGPRDAPPLIPTAAPPPPPKRHHPPRIILEK
jgi:hypothetical protein